MTGAKEERKLVAMQYGDHSWMQGLAARPELNGRHVVLRKWLQEEQRWRCEPVGWSFERPMISVRPKNLSSEPPPPPKASTPTPDVAFQLMKLVEREGHLRASAHLSPAARLRHLSCQGQLLKVQAEILSHRDDKSLAAEALQRLEVHERDAGPALKRWKEAGGLPLDIWQNDE